MIQIWRYTMSDQNIYDNQDFFNGYQRIRQNPLSANNMIEKPALFSLCPSFIGKKVLDLGCGYGENCLEFIRLGARKVVGIDISKNMIAVANDEIQNDKITFLEMSMSDLSSIHETFDFIISSLAFHYIEDFDALLHQIYQLLNDDGLLIFSQEHPINTALLTDNHWTYDEKGNVLHFNLSNYANPGKRAVHWIVDDVIKYHRTFSLLTNSVIDAGFTIEKVLEPLPSHETIEQAPAYAKRIHKPDFLFIKARKKSQR